MKYGHSQRVTETARERVGWDRRARASETHREKAKWWMIESDIFRHGESGTGSDRVGDEVVVSLFECVRERGPDREIVCRGRVNRVIRIVGE